jgi:hypothetical protein
MIETLVLIVIFKKMGEVLRSKGWTTTIWMQMLAVLVWIGFEVFGAFAYTVYVILTKGEDAVDDIGFAVYIVALPCALAGIGILFLVTKFLPEKNLAQKGEHGVFADSRGGV